MINSFGISRTYALLVLSLNHVSAPSATFDTAPLAARITETRTYRIWQTVSVTDVPANKRETRMWVPVPADGPWQHVLERRVLEAPGAWKLAHQSACDADMIVATGTGGGTHRVVVETTVVRESPAFDLTAASNSDIQPSLFVEELRLDSPLMSPDMKMTDIAETACKGEQDPRRKVIRLLDAVADLADHYSKDPTKPQCGRGSAEDCMANGGGCCTDMHSLFIALARTEGIPARIQFGYRLKPDMENTEYDPSYRCWVEYFLPGSGWVPTDIVVADAGERDARMSHYGNLDAQRVWLWQGRGIDLVPKQSGPAIQTMLCGWAEIDGVPVDVLPAADKTPSKLKRTIRFQDLTPKPATAAK
jgi:transglutaminase-like putative cysteine protease